MCVCVLCGLREFEENLIFPLGAFNEPRWQGMLPKLQALDKLLNSVTWKERFAARCFPDEAAREKLKHWPGVTLKSLRWEAVADFCCAAT